MTLYPAIQVFNFVPDAAMGGSDTLRRKPSVAQLLGVLSAESLRKEAPAGGGLRFPRLPLPTMAPHPVTDLGGRT